MKFTKLVVCGLCLSTGLAYAQGSYIRMDYLHNNQSSSVLTQQMGKAKIPFVAGGIKRVKLGGSSGGFDFAYGYTFDSGNWHFGPEIAYNNFANIGNTFKGFLQPPAGYPRVNSKLAVQNKTQAMMLNIVVSNDVGAGFNVFASAGIGPARIKSDTALEMSEPSAPSRRGEARLTTTNLAWQLSVGAEYQLRQFLGLRAALSYVNFGDVKLGNFGQSQIYSGTTYNADKLRSIVLGLGVVYHF